MTIRFEPKIWLLKNDRFEIIQWQEDNFTAKDFEAEDEIDCSGDLPTFNKAVAWCESRSAAGQGEAKS